MSPKSHVLAAFQAAKINLDGTTWITTCACLIGGRYVAYYGSHGGWQIGRDRSPKTRTTVTQDQAIAWANNGVWADGTACLNGFKVVDGVEKGREKKAEETPVVSASSLTQPVPDMQAIIAQAVAAALKAHGIG